MNLVARHGDEAAAVLVKHAGVAEPVLEGFGAPAVRALAEVGPQGGRRLAMLMADGDLARIGRTPEVLEVMAKYGDRAADFVWKHQGALAVGATLTAFLAKPEAFLNAAQGVSQMVAESAVRPLAEAPGKAVEGVAKGTNWTVVFSVVVLVLAGFAVLRWRLHSRPASDRASQVSTGDE